MNTVPSNKKKTTLVKKVSESLWTRHSDGGGGRGGVLWMIDAMMTINQGVSRVLGPSDRR